MVKDSFTQLGKLIPNLTRTSPTMPQATKPIEKNAWRLAAGNDIADHTAVRVENNIWTITADGPVWGHAVKQRQRQILSNLKNQNFLAVKLNIQVRPVNSSSVPASEPSVKNIQVLDEKSADLLLATAKTLKSSDLAEAIKKLSERHREEKK